MTVAFVDLPRITGYISLCCLWFICLFSPLLNSVLCGCGIIWNANEATGKHPVGVSLTVATSSELVVIYFTDRLMRKWGNWKGSGNGIGCFFILLVAGLGIPD